MTTATIHRTPFLAETQPECLVIHCSDGRFQPYFREFLADRLGTEQYALLAVPGGCQFLTLLDYMPKFSWVGWRWVKFLADVAKPRRVVIIGHDDCLWYRDARFWLPEPDVRKKTLADLAAVGRSISDRFGLTVDLFFARLDGGDVAFDSVSPRP